MKRITTSLLFLFFLQAIPSHNIIIPNRSKIKELEEKFTQITSEITTFIKEKKTGEEDARTLIKKLTDLSDEEKIKNIINEMEKKHGPLLLIELHSLVEYLVKNFYLSLKDITNAIEEENIIFFQKSATNLINDLANISDTIEKNEIRETALLLMGSYMEEFFQCKEGSVHKKEIPESIINECILRFIPRCDDIVKQHILWNVFEKGMSNIINNIALYKENDSATFSSSVVVEITKKFITAITTKQFPIIAPSFSFLNKCLNLPIPLIQLFSLAWIEQIKKALVKAKKKEISRALYQERTKKCSPPFTSKRYIVYIKLKNRIVCVLPTTGWSSESIKQIEKNKKIYDNVNKKVLVPLLYFVPFKKGEEEEFYNSDIITLSLLFRSYKGIDENFIVVPLACTTKETDKKEQDGVIEPLEDVITVAAAYLGEGEQRMGIMYGIQDYLYEPLKSEVTDPWKSPFNYELFCKGEKNFYTTRDDGHEYIISTYLNNQSIDGDSALFWTLLREEPFLSGVYRVASNNYYRIVFSGAKKTLQAPFQQINANIKEDFYCQKGIVTLSKVIDSENPAEAENTPYEKSFLLCPEENTPLLFTLGKSGVKLL